MAEGSAARAALMSGKRADLGMLDACQFGIRPHTEVSVEVDCCGSASLTSLLKRD